jgi:hypothetical protein
MNINALVKEHLEEIGNDLDLLWACEQFETRIITDNNGMEYVDVDEFLEDFDDRLTSEVFN